MLERKIFYIGMHMQDFPCDSTHGIWKTGQPMYCSGKSRNLVLTAVVKEENDHHGKE